MYPEKRPNFQKTESFKKREGTKVYNCRCDINCDNTVELYIQNVVVKDRRFFLFFLDFLICTNSSIYLSGVNLWKTRRCYFHGELRIH